MGNNKGNHQTSGLQTVQMVENQREESAQGAAPAPVQYFCCKQRAVRFGKICTLENPCELRSNHEHQ